MHRQTAQFEPLLFNAKHMNQSKNNVASINQKTITFGRFILDIGMLSQSLLEA